MQKKIMLALIISSNGMLVCQVPPSAPAAQTDANMPAATTTTAVSSEQAAPASAAEAPMALAQPAQSAPAQAQPVVQTSQITSPTTAAATQAAVAPAQAQAAPVAVPEPVEPSVSQPIEQPKPVEEAKPAELPKEIEFKPQPQEAEDEDIEIKGIDTVDINEPKGNWLYKRIWWEKAERTYEKIKQLTDKILESRMSFFVKRNELDRLIVEFYSDLGFKQGELTELVAFMTRQLEAERQTEGSLSEKERELLELLTQEKTNIEQLQQGNQNITKIDHALEDALMKLVEQLNQAKYYEQQAWENFKAINRELSDKKARELFYGMDTYYRNLNSINSYLSDAFAKYFDQLSLKLQQETDKIKTNAQALAEKGISLQSQALVMKKECKMPTKEEIQASETEQPKSLLGSLWGWIKTPFSAIGTIFGGVSDWVAGLFGGSTSDELVLAKPSGSRTKASSVSTEEPS